MKRIFLQIFIIKNIIFCLLCNDYSQIFKMDIFQENEVSSSGFLDVNYQKFGNFRIFITKKLYDWFLNEKENICKSFKFDPIFSSIKFHISEKKGNAVFIKEKDPCCKLSAFFG